MMAVLSEMKKRIPEHPVLKQELDKLMEDGLSEDEALNIMIYVWLISK